MVKNDDISKTKSLIGRAYGCACAHGFHEEALSVEHMLMLVLSEIGEAVEADRKGKNVDFCGIKKCMQGSVDFPSMFSTFIKDSLPDELADVCIRLYDMCGALGIEPRVEYETMEADFQEIFGEDTFCERMYYLSRLLCGTNGVIDDDGADECLPQVIGSALSFLFALAKDMGIDLVRHIEFKMKYNEARPYRNGKKY